MGYVMEGRDEFLGRRVAIKTMHQHLCDNPRIFERFLREARAMAAIDHPNVVRILDAFDWEGLPVMVMEHIDGEPLSALARRERPMRPHRVGALLRGALRGLAAAHAHGIFHRDIKPDNLLVVIDATGESSIKIIDFGLAHVEGQEGHTRLGSAVGTLRYMSPEQVRGQGDIDARADLYSLGTLCWELLAGRYPWKDVQDDLGLRERIVTTPLPPLPPTITSAWALWIERMTAKDRQERPKDAADAYQCLPQDAPDPAPLTAPNPTVAAPPDTLPSGAPRERNIAHHAFQRWAAAALSLALLLAATGSALGDDAPLLTRTVTYSACAIIALEIALGSLLRRKGRP